MGLCSSDGSITGKVRHMLIILKPDQEVIPDWVGPGFREIGEGSSEAIYCDVELIPGGRLPSLSCGAGGACASAIDI